MRYPVIVEQRNGLWRAVIPALSGLSAEGRSRDEAMQNAQQAAENYLSKVEVTTIEVGIRSQRLRTGSPQAVLASAGKFNGDEEAMRRHIEEIYAERRRQCKAVEHEIDKEEFKGAPSNPNEDPA